MGHVVMTRYWILLVTLLISIEAKPPTGAGHTWLLPNVAQQSQQPLVVNQYRVQNGHSIPRFQLPTANRRHDTSFNSLQEEGGRPIMVQPGDTVSLVVTGKESNQYSDVKTLLSALQTRPTTNQNNYNVFLAPPHYQPKDGGQKFDVTYVNPPVPAQQPHQPGTSHHPPLFVAPVNYSVPHGYGRVQVPTHQVQFGFRPLHSGQPHQSPVQTGLRQQQHQLPVQTEHRQHQSPVLSGQLHPPQSVASAPAPPPAPVQDGPEPWLVPPRFAYSPPPVHSPPQTVRWISTAPVQSPVLDETRLQGGFVPARPIEQEPIRQPAPLPPQHLLEPVPQRTEPLVLAEESPDFLREEVERPQPQQLPPVIQPVELQLPVPSQEPFRPLEPITPPEVVVAPQPEVADPPEILQVPQVADLPEIPQVPEVADPPAIPQVPEAPQVTQPPEAPFQVPEPTTTNPAGRKPSKKVKVVVKELSKPRGAQPEEPEVSPQWPDFQSVRRKQANRQKNRTPINPPAPVDDPASSIAAETPAAWPEAQEADVPLTYGQRIRTKPKDEALTARQPLPAAPIRPIMHLPPPRFRQEKPSLLDEDSPLLEQDEPFQTLESQNKAPSIGRGRVRFQAKAEGSGTINVIPAVNLRPETATSTASIRTISNPELRKLKTRVRIRPLIPVAVVEEESAFAATSQPEVLKEAAEEVQVELKKEVEQTEPEEEVEVEEEEEEEPEVDQINEEEEEEEVEDEVVDEVVDEVDEEEEEAQQEEEENEEAEEAEQEEEEEEEEEEAAEATPTAEEPALPVVKTRDEQPWSPYEAIRQMQTAEQKRNQGNAIRTRGKITYASTRPALPIRPIRPISPIRTVTPVRPNTSLRPASAIRTPPQPEDPESQGLREGSSPVSPEFGTRGRGDADAPSSDIRPVNLPVGRRVPEFRPKSAIKIGRPKLNPAIKIEDPVKSEQEASDHSAEDEFDPELLTGDGDEELEEELLDNEPEEEEEEEELEELEELEEDLQEEQLEEAEQEEPLLEEAQPEVVEPEVSQEVDQEEIQPPEEDEQSTTSVPVVETTTVAPSTTPPPQITTTSAPEVVQEDKPPTATEEREVLGVSTATEVSMTYELCYRGRCVTVHE